jgi:AraC family transcriptional regulator of adaptative response/methylated-DNA-[protein]-cysteine methyltransferase
MKKEMSFEEKYQAILDKNSLYEGVFYTCVKTTGIFCRPVCTARKPKPENVEFVESIKTALARGFRPCKVCKPVAPKDETPENIKSVLEELHQNPFLRIKDYQLRERGIEPAYLRRWFKKHYQMTFHAYQRMLRLNLAFQDIQKGKTVTDAAFSNGFESLSGFNESFKSFFGDPATISSKEKLVITIERINSRLGPMYACASERGLCLLEFTERRMLEREFKDLQKRLKAVILPGKHPHIEQAKKELEEYFKGERKAFEVKLDTPGTDFQNKVWNQLLKIPYGETRSYKKQAEMLGNPDAVRAVARANGMNRIAIIIPCHRVIGENGELKGYAGGLPRKRWLLDFEYENYSIFKKS